MRVSIFSLLLTAVGLLGETQISNAQSTYSYPWCAIYDSSTGIGGARSCYYTSWQQCRTTMSGVGGYCVQNPGYRPRQSRTIRR
jgi:hypothetical protein